MLANSSSKAINVVFKQEGGRSAPNVRYCSFHVMQAIDRQLRQRNKYDLLDVDAEVVKCVIRQLKESDTKDEYDKLLPDAKKRLATIGKNQALLQWLNEFYIDDSSRYNNF